MNHYKPQHHSHYDIILTLKLWKNTLLRERSNLHLSAEDLRQGIQVQHSCMRLKLFVSILNIRDHLCDLPIQLEDKIINLIADAMIIP